MPSSERQEVLRSGELLEAFPFGLAIGCSCNLFEDVLFRAFLHVAKASPCDPGLLVGFFTGAVGQLLAVGIALTELEIAGHHVVVGFTANDDLSGAVLFNFSGVEIV